MGRGNTKFEESSYYPPRARWYGAVFAVTDAVRRMLRERAQLSEEVPLGRLVAGFLIPGMGIYLRGPKILGICAMWLCLCLLAVFVVWLGYPAANLAFGAAVSLHVTGFNYQVAPLMADKPLGSRLLFTVLALIGLGCLIYLPLRDAVAERWLMPLRLHGNVVVVQRWAMTNNLARGDWVAYDFPGTGGFIEGGVLVHAGVDLGPVLALAGDEVTFSTNLFMVNGLAQERLHNMPQTGGFTVPENRWFIWPNVAINGHGHVSEEAISGMLVELGLVSKDRVVGRPLKQWFWRRQKLS